MVEQTASSPARGGRADHRQRSPRRSRMRRVTTVALALALLVGGCTNGGNRKPSADWKLVWSDSFDGPANSQLSRREWLYNAGTSYPGGAQNWGTAEIETM